MARKTISLEIDGYVKLKKAKRSPTESFSAVVRRARWDDASSTAQGLLDSLKRLSRSHPESFLADRELDEIERQVGTRRGRLD